jgi:hypothetical protein
MEIPCAICLFMTSAVVFAQESIAVREASKGNFVGSVISNAELAAEEGQRRLLAVASDTCKSRTPKFGRYEFKSTKRLTGAPTLDRFEFNQEFTCQTQAEVPVVRTQSTAISDEEKERLVALVTSETRNAIASHDSAALMAFHAKFSPSLGAMLTQTEWTSAQLLLHKKSGAIKADPLLQVTTYIDPPDSPGPGIYLAVDFQASYERAPFRCGYVIWLFDQESKLTVMRLEDGIIYSKEAALMTAKTIEQTKQQIRCFAL